MKKTFLVALVGAAVIQVGITGASYAQSQANIYKLHSLFIYNFVKNINWKNPGSQFTIGVYGNTNALHELKASFVGKKFGSSTFNIQNVSSGKEAENCQILYLPKSNRAKVSEMLEEARKYNILVVTEEDLISEGASISFEMTGSRLNFKINKNETDHDGLKMSSSLLALGTVVE